MRLGDIRPGATRASAWLLVALLLHATASVAQTSQADGLLDAMFQDHAVLQRDQPIRIWGSAPAGRQVDVSLDARHMTTRAKADGTWEALLPGLPAGGPYTLTVREGVRTRTVTDVLVGDVWLCSGQSNMELPVWRSLDAASEMANADAPTIRLLKVPQKASPVPLHAFAAAPSWQAVSPTSLHDFSAACFYFARELQKHHDVPMGLINAAWGGSRIKAWLDGDALKDDRHYRQSLALLALYGTDPLGAARQWGDTWASWWEKRAGTAKGDRPWEQPDPAPTAWRDAPDALGPWEHWNVPALADFNGMVWFRTVVTLAPAQARQDAVLELGALDETDVTWVNGRAVGGNYDPGSPRRYPLPRKLLKAGDNTIVINVLDTWGEGGMRAPASAYRLVLEDGTRVPLASWQYRMAAPGQAPPNAPWQSAGGLTTLYNGMIAPLGRYGLRGILWYQGESNTGEASGYRELLERLSSGWRARFGDDLPILLVQLAGYGPPPTSPGDSGWASLRQAQRDFVRADPHAALAITLDIGDRYDIHPPNKQEAGRRLARAARQLVYREPIPASGPVAVLARLDAGAVVVRFDDVDGALVAYGARGPIGFELCGEAVGSCEYADGRIVGSEVVLPGRSGRTATHVRYGWADNPVINLFDASGLPAGPFDIVIGDDHASKHGGGAP